MIMRIDQYNIPPIIHGYKKWIKEEQLWPIVRLMINQSIMGIAIFIPFPSSLFKGRYPQTAVIGEQAMATV